ncbi:MAG: Na(+)-translocating NADH-quinone reductase subunit C [Acidobacteriota bacterium]
MQSFSVRYIILFSLAICGVCAIFVSSLAVSLAPLQDVNKVLDRKKNVLMAAGLLEAGEAIAPEEVEKRFASFTPVVVDLATGQELADVDPVTFDQRKVRNDPATSEVAPQNNAGIARVPNQALVYKAVDEAGELDMVIVPVEGYGLWSTLYGFLALDADLNTVKGLAYYEHGETPGLGGEVENPRWRSVWVGRKIYDDSGATAIEVIKGAAGPVESAPHKIDGISGATITARGVSNMMRFWLGDEGFKPYFDNIHSGNLQASAPTPKSKEAA